MKEVNTAADTLDQAYGREHGARGACRCTLADQQATVIGPAILFVMDAVCTTMAGVLGPVKCEVEISSHTSNGYLRVSHVAKRFVTACIVT